MRLVVLAGLFLISFGRPGWESDFEVAKQKAASANKFILVSFSGSDWCGPCIRLEKEVFNSPEFASLAKAHLILVNADFPRLRKNQLDKEQQKKNDALADRYNAKGIFPYTLLLDSSGKIRYSWEGYPDSDPTIFLQTLKQQLNAGH